MWEKVGIYPSGQMDGLGRKEFLQSPVILLLIRRLDYKMNVK